MLLPFFVLTRILANPISNALQKRLTHQAADPLFIVLATHALLTLAALPILLHWWPLSLPVEFWKSIVVAVLLAVSGNALLIYALRLSDLSVLGPINAYKAVVGLILGIFLVGEIPSLFGALGVLLIVAGSYFVIDRPQGVPRRAVLTHFFVERGIRYRFLALFLSAVEAIYLKKALLASSPLTTFVFWSILGLPLALMVVLAVFKGRIGMGLITWTRQRSTYLWLALTTGLMQLATLFTFGVMQVGYSLALFQTSTLVSVFLGYRYFREENIPRRLLGSLIMIAGAVCIVVLGRGT